MAENITLVTYAGSSVTPQHDAVLADLELPGNGIIYGCNVTIKNATTLHISAGMGVIYGREFEIIDNDITVPLSTQGALLGQLYIHMDLSNTTEPIQLLIQTGSAREELIDDPTINTSAGVTEMQMAIFTIDTSTLDNLEVTFSVLENLKESVKDLKSEVVKSITRNGTTFIAKNEADEILFTFNQQDNDTKKGNGITTNETKNGSGTTLNKSIPENTTMDNAFGIILNGLNALDVVNGIQNNDIPWYGTSSTAAATAAKVATTTDVKLGALAVGQKVRIKFTNANTAAAPTLNVDSKGAKAIKAYGTTAPTVMWKAGDVVDFTYDGTNWIMGATAGMIDGLNSDLTAKVGNFTSGNYKAVTGLAYDSTNKKLGLKVGADTIIPFSGSGFKELAGGTYREAKILNANLNILATVPAGKTGSGNYIQLKMISAGEREIYALQAGKYSIYDFSGGNGEMYNPEYVNVASSVTFPYLIRAISGTAAFNVIAL